MGLGQKQALYKGVRVLGRATACLGVWGWGVFPITAHTLGGHGGICPGSVHGSRWAATAG